MPANDDHIPNPLKEYLCSLDTLPLEILQQLDLRALLISDA